MRSQIDQQKTNFPYVNKNNQNGNSNKSRTDGNKQKFINQVDRENIVEEYRSLRQKHKDWLGKINMTEKQKRQIFGFSNSYSCSNKAEKTSLVTVQDPFKGKLIIKESEWELINANNKKKAKKEQSPHEPLPDSNQFAKLDISVDSPDRLIPQQRINSGDKLLEKENKEEGLSSILNKFNNFDEPVKYSKISSDNKKVEQISSIHKSRTQSNEQENYMFAFLKGARKLN